MKDIREEYIKILREKIILEFGNDKTKVGRTHIKNLICPKCGKDAWSYRKSPYKLFCNNHLECGIVKKTLYLMDDYADFIEKKYEEDPVKQSIAYFQNIRGIYNPKKYFDIDYIIPKSDGLVKSRKSKNCIQY